ncbi:hypothetical protein SDC9_159270 [bioreactor metagenome]|uniref:Uncharacterized protein n=1 Tax=bioreactor metagenome TaxID=1076179 RepID=A0A645FCB2_9ZZZZ
MPIALVFAEADIRDDVHFRIFFLDNADGLLDNPIIHKGWCCFRVLFIRHAEQNNVTDAQRLQLIQFLWQHIERQVVLTLHGRDFTLNVFPVYHKQRVNHIAHG